MPLLMFLLLMLAEIAGFILVGQAIGVLGTLGLVIAGGAAGLFLIRQCGIAGPRAVIEAQQRGEPPDAAAFAMLATFAAGLFLILPGFLTDLTGVLLLLPPVRRLWFPRFRHQGSATLNIVIGGQAFRPNPGWRRPPERPINDNGHGPRVIDVEHQDIDPPDREPRP